MSRSERLEVIVWRGIRFEHHSGLLCLGNGSFEYKLYKPQASRGDKTYVAVLFERWFAEGDTAEEALESARSQVESIARAVGLIPESRITKVEAGTLTDAMRYPENGYHHCRWCNSKAPEPHDERCWYKWQCEQVDKARALVDQLAAKLGKGER